MSRCKFHFNYYEYFTKLPLITHFSFIHIFSPVFFHFLLFLGRSSWEKELNNNHLPLPISPGAPGCDWHSATIDSVITQEFLHRKSQFHVLSFWQNQKGSVRTNRSAFFLSYNFSIFSSARENIFSIGFFIYLHVDNTQTAGALILLARRTVLRTP